MSVQLIDAPETEVQPTGNQDPSPLQRRGATKYKWATIFWLAVLHLGALAAPFTFTWTGLALMLVLGWLTAGIGISLGYHRLFTHRSFAVVRPLRWAIALLGSLAGQGPLIGWVADHRKHHALSDRRGDPHSPNDGVWWSHLVWLVVVSPYDEEEHRRHWAPDLLKEPVLGAISRLFFVWNFLFAGLLFGLGYLMGGSPLAWSLLVWGMFVRLVYVLHATFFVNSASHLWGYRNYTTRDNSRNLWWVALTTFGEGWHNNHHAHPRSASNWHRWWEIDVTYAAIRLLGALGLAWDLVSPPAAPGSRRSDSRRRGA